MGLGFEGADRASSETLPPSGIQLPASPAELSEHFPELEVLELVGQGGMGVVYKARQRELDRVVALKILPPEAAEDPAFSERFAREAKTLAKMNHPHIVAVHEVGRRCGFYYFIMEYVDGVNLRQAIQSQTLSPQDALAVVRQVCEALEYAHGLGVVHRDIKPENVLLDKQGRVKIADFGLAKFVRKAPADITLTQAHQAMGTPHYMAPEQLHRPLEVDHRADIYSLGVVFYEVLTGELPIGRFDPPSRKVRVDVRLDEIVLRTLEREPDRRYQAVSDLGADVESLSGPAPESKPLPLSRQTKKASDGSMEVTAAWICAVLSLVVFVVGLLGSAMLLVIAPPDRGTAIFLFALGSMIVAIVLGLLGFRYRLGRYTALAAVLLTLGVASLIVVVPSGGPKAGRIEPVISAEPADAGATLAAPAPGNTENWTSQER
jgi:predicted Ser/Thr protein kinase